MTDEPCRYCNDTKRVRVRYKQSDPTTEDDCPMCDGRFDEANAIRQTLVMLKLTKGLSEPEFAALRALQKLTAFYCDSRPERWENLERLRQKLDEIDRATAEVDRMLKPRYPHGKDEHTFDDNGWCTYPGCPATMK